MAAEKNRAVVGIRVPMKTRLPVLMLALTLITSTGKAKIPKEANMNLTSPDFGEGGNIPERFTCDGKDISPTLKIDGIPKGAKSLVLIVDDPDAPGGNFTHWLIWNIVPDLTEIVANKLPAHAVQGVNDFGKSKYSGPCPPAGVHRYYFRLYALDTTLTLPQTSKRKVVDSAIKGHIVADATLMGRYARKSSNR
jgi:Raf kinase inhibitor-like YbhB/YbcL family protein